MTHRDPVRRVRAAGVYGWCGRDRGPCWGCCRWVVSSVIAEVVSLAVAGVASSAVAGVVSSAVAEVASSAISEVVPSAIAGAVSSAVVEVASLVVAEVAPANRLAGFLVPITVGCVFPNRVNRMYGTVSMLSWPDPAPMC